MQAKSVSVEGKREEIARSLGFMTASELAVLAGVKAETLEAWRKRKQGPAYVHFGNEPLYPFAGVKKYLESLCCEKVAKSSRSASYVMDAL